MGGAAINKVDLQIQRASPRAQKLTRVTTGLTAMLGFGAWGLITSNHTGYFDSHFYLAVFLIVIGGISFKATTAGKKAGYFWLFLSLIGLGYLDLMALLSLIPIPLAYWWGRQFFKKHPTFFAFTVLIPIFVCSGLWGGGFWLAKNWEHIPGLFEKLKVEPSPVLKPSYPATHVISPQGASVRSGPGATYHRIGALPYLAPVKIIARQGSWYQVKFGVNDQVGYIYQNLIGGDLNPVQHEPVPNPLTSAIEESESTGVKVDSASQPPQMMNIKFESEPSSAHLFLNGQYVGSTPMRLQLAIGEFLVLLEQEGFEKYQQRIELTSDGQNEFTFELTPLQKASVQSEIADEADEISQNFDTIPVPEGGYEAIQKTLQYPSRACADRIEGTILVQVLVDKKGRIKDTKILKSLGNTECDDAAITAIKQVNWKPAMYQNHAVTVWVTVPVRFKLNE